MGGGQEGRQLGPGRQVKEAAAGREEEDVHTVVAG